MELWNQWVAFNNSRFGEMNNLVLWQKAIILVWLVIAVVCVVGTLKSWQFKKN